MLAALLGLCGEGGITQRFLKYVLLFDATIKVEFHEYFLDVLIK